MIRRPRFIINFSPGLVLGLWLALAVGVLAFFSVARMIDKENQDRFRAMAQSAQYTINARIQSYTNVVRAAESMFRADPFLTREQFHRFVTGLDAERNYPAIVTINYVQYVRDSERNAYVADMIRQEQEARDGRPAFRIVPAGRRPEYAVVTFVEPEHEWLDSIGTDLFVQPVMLKTLGHARDTGKLSASGIPVEIMRKKHLFGLAMRLPVYRPGAPLENIEQRRAAYLGSVGIAFSVGQLVHGVLDEMPLKAVRLTLFNQAESVDPAKPKSEQMIYDSGDQAGGPEKTLPRPDRFNVWLPIDFNGRKWSAHFSVPRQALRRTSDTSFPWLALLTGFTTTALLYAPYLILTASRSHAIELADAMTQELRDSEAKLIASHQKLRQLTAHTEHIKEMERKRIAREIHDDLGQNLLALRIDAQMLFARTHERHRILHARAAETLGHIDSTIQSVRQIINDLRPNVLDLGLNAAVDWQISEFRRRSSIRCELVEDAVDIVANDQCATALFRILQESLSNVRRHAMATRVRVELRMEGERVRMRIRDNGIGVKPGQHAPGKFGLIGMEERVKALGGTFIVRTPPEGGTVIDVTIPLPQDAANTGPPMPSLEEDHSPQALA
nr:CHASE domain-containing protein [Massilia terrae]